MENVTEQVTIEFSLPEITHDALQRIASDEGVEIEHVLHSAIRRDLFRRSRAEKIVRADDQHLTILRVHLAEDFAFAHSWDDLKTRLRAKGYLLREAGAGLALHKQSCGTQLCRVSELGNSYAHLMRRFLTPFPNHSHRCLPEKIAG